MNYDSISIDYGEAPKNHGTGRECANCGQILTKYNKYTTCYSSDPCEKRAKKRKESK